MASTGQKWAVGCGIGCLLLVVILGGIGTCTYVGIKRIEQSAEGLEAQIDALDERYGPAKTYVPEPDGVIAAETIEDFLDVRADMRERGADMVMTLAALDDGNALEKARAVMRLIPGILEFVGQHAAALLEKDLNPGEYTYLYAVVYYAWLGHDPGDGPDFQLDDNGKNSEKGFRWRTDSGGHEVRTDRARKARRVLNDLMLSWLGNQQDALAAANDVDSEWAETLATELARLRGDPERIAWEEGLPEPLASSLAPYRDALEDTYSELLNGLEVALLDED